MRYIDPHIHMVSRTTDDYEAMAAASVVAVIEPSFWQGQPRTQAGTFIDYFDSLIGWERFRASQFGINHCCTIGINPTIVVMAVSSTGRNRSAPAFSAASVGPIPLPRCSL